MLALVFVLVAVFVLVDSFANLTAIFLIFPVFGSSQSNSFNPALLALLKASENEIGSYSFNTTSCLGACIVVGADWYAAIPLVFTSSLAWACLSIAWFLLASSIISLGDFPPFWNFFVFSLLYFILKVWLNLLYFKSLLGAIPL